MRDLVRAIVRGELGVSGPGGARAEAVPRAFLTVFQLISMAPGRLRASPGEEAAVSDLIAAHLLQHRRQDAGGLDRHLRFQGLRQRLRTQPWFLRPEVRCAVLRLLHALRSPAGGAGDVAGSDMALRGEAAGELFEPLRAPAELAVAPAVALAPPRPHAKVVPHLGWHMAGASMAPSSISEPQLLRDILHALQGVDSACFRFDQSEGRFQVNSSFVLARPAWFMVQRMLELGGLHMRLCRAVGTAREGNSGKSLLHQALSEALYEQLQDYTRILVLLMSKAGATDPGADGVPELTLRRLWAWLLVPLERMRLLSTLCEACAPLRGGALASAVHGFSRVGDASAHDACVAVLQKVVGPLLAMIRAWMTEGELQDPFGEFFVCADASVPLEDLWTSMYSLEVEMVPRFLTLELARKILLTGKSVNFIRLCCPGQDWLLAATAPGPGEQRATGGADPGGAFLASPLDPRAKDDIPAGAGAVRAVHGEWLIADLSARVEQAARRTNRHLVSLMMECFALGEHCLALRRFMLLGQGDFVESLMDLASAELCRDAAEVQRHQLVGLVDQAVRQSNAQFCPPDVVARLGVKLLVPSTGERGWDVFLLDYAIDSPLHVVFTASAMQQYDRAFAFLWKLRRVSHALAACWSQHMALQRHLVACSPQLSIRAPELGLEMRQTLHRCTCLRNEMQHFVQNVRSHIMCEVVETSWAKLQAAWQACADLDEVILEHQRYLARIEEGAFLAPKAEPIFAALGALFGLALEFTELHDQVCASAFEAVEVLLREPDGLVPFARSLAECRAQLDQIGQGFQVRLQALLRALEAQAALRHLSADLRFLQCRLDFNGHYELRRPAPASERPWLG